MTPHSSGATHPLEVGEDGRTVLQPGGGKLKLGALLLQQLAQQTACVVNGDRAVSAVQNRPAREGSARLQQRGAGPLGPAPPAASGQLTDPAGLAENEEDLRGHREQAGLASVATTADIHRGSRPLRAQRTMKLRCGPSGSATAPPVHSRVRSCRSAQSWLWSGGW